MDELLLLIFGWPLLRRWFGGQGSPFGGPEELSASEILRQRYARGEISREQFEDMQKVLDNQQKHEPATDKAA